MRKLIIGLAAAAILALSGIAAMAAAPNTDQQEENYSFKGSVAVADQKDQRNEAADGKEAEGKDTADGKGETPDASDLKSLAKIDRSTAEQATLKAVPGTVKETDLEVENGFVVYGVEVAGNDGKTHDVKVDAGNAKVLHQQVDGADGPRDSEDAN